MYDERYSSATHTPVLDADSEVAAILQHTTEVTELHRLREAAGNGISQLEGGVLARAQAVQSANLALDARQRQLRHLFACRARLAGAVGAGRRLGAAVLQRDPSVQLLFTDVVMPGPLNSAQLAQQARELRPGLHVLLTSGYVDDRIGRAGRIDPALPMIAKLYQRDDLARRIRQLLDVEPAPPSDWSGADLQLSVLFVDDDEDLQYIGAEVLRMMGNEVRTAASAEEALALLGSSHFDVLVTDVGLPGMSGIELARLARQRTPALKVVLASGYGRSALPDGDQIREHTVLLPKPYSSEAMAQALRRACNDG